MSWHHLILVECISKIELKKFLHWIRAVVMCTISIVSILYVTISFLTIYFSFTTCTEFFVSYFRLYYYHWFIVLKIPVFRPIVKKKRVKFHNGVAIESEMLQFYRNFLCFPLSTWTVFEFFLFRNEQVGDHFGSIGFFR